MKKISIIALILFVGSIGFASCGKKSQANKEQIENAREEADAMTSGYDASKSMKPGSNGAKVTFDTETVTEIIVSEDSTVIK